MKTRQVIHIVFEGTDLFLRVAGAGIKPLKQLAKLFMGILAKEKMEGKTSMKNLLKRGSDMHVFKFPQEQLKKVEAMAKKYGILYSLLPDFNKDGMREMVFHATPYTMAAVFFTALLYVMVQKTNRKNYRFGKEHGSAR
ncbi:MAG: PcfB family protein [Lachnospiraceae bacterium]|nr:PcfB family protein [Lachnospiraceae bacterium]